MMNRIGCRLQLPTTNLTLPNRVDGILFLPYNETNFEANSLILIGADLKDY